MKVPGQLEATTLVCGLDRETDYDQTRSVCVRAQTLLPAVKVCDSFK